MAQLKDLIVNGAAKLLSTLRVSGDTHIDGTLYLNGAIGSTFNPVYVDSNGQIVATSVNASYAHSLTGTDNDTKYTLELIAENAAVLSTVHIPEATTTNIGLVSNNAQTWAGTKTFTGTGEFKSTVLVHNSKQWPAIYFRTTDSTTNVSGLIWTGANSSGNITESRWLFREFSYASTAQANALTYYEDFRLPNVTADRTENKTYDILTTKATVTVSQGGTGQSSFTADRVILSNAGSSTGAFTSRAYTDNTSATALANNSTNFVTMRTVYFGLPTINNAHDYTSATNIYAPTAGGTADTQALVGNGTTSAPKWVDISPTAAWTTGTSTDGPTLKITVLGQTQTTGVAVPSGTTAVYGVLRLTSSTTVAANVDDETYAVTIKGVWAAINTLDASFTGAASKTLTALTQTNGKITTATFTDIAIAASQITSGTLGTARGGTGNSSYTAKRLVWTESATKFTAGYHYADSTHVGICTTSVPSTNFYVTGTSHFTGNITTGNATIWCGSFTANTAGSGERQIGVADGAGKLYICSKAETTGNRGLYGCNAAGTNTSYLQIDQSNYVHLSVTTRPRSEFSLWNANGTGDMYFSAGCDATDTTLDATATTAYTSIAGNPWFRTFFFAPRKTRTYATAGDTSSTVTITLNKRGYIEFREYSYNNNTLARLSYYEAYRLPFVTADLTGNQTYDILTTRNTITVAQGGTGKSSWTQWGVIYASASTTLAQVAAGSSDNQYKFLMSNGAAAPIWSAAWNLETAGKNLVNGTNLNNISYGVSYVTDSASMKTIVNNPMGDQADSGGIIVTMHGYNTSSDWQFEYPAAWGPLYRHKKSGTWQDWRIFVNMKYGTDIGSSALPVYVNAKGQIIAVTKGDLFSALSWTAGTTAGPILSITIAGQNRTAVIPSAGTGASGIVTTGAQRFRGEKRLEYPTITNNNSRYQGFNYKNDALVKVAEHWYDTGDATNITYGRFGWREYSPKAAGDGVDRTTTTGKYETYYLPAVNVGRTENQDYEILTNKVYAKPSKGTATRIVYYSDADTMASASHIQYIPEQNAELGTTKGKVNGLFIFGTAYGNTAANLGSNTKNVFRYGDPGPQIRFSTSLGSANAGANESGAIIWSNNSTDNNLDQAFYFVGRNDADLAEANIGVISKIFVARTRMTIGQNYNDTDYNLYVNGTSYMSGNLTFANDDVGVVRVGRSKNWNNADEGAIVRQTSTNGLSPIFAMHANKGHWVVAAYNNASYQDEFLFGYIHADDHTGATTPNNQWRTTVSLLPVDVTGAETARRAIVVAPYIRTSATNGTAKVGSLTQPVYVDTDSVIKPTSYALKATVNAGTATHIAYYSSADAISTCANYWVNDTSINFKTAAFARTTVLSESKEGCFYIRGSGTGDTTGIIAAIRWFRWGDDQRTGLGLRVCGQDEHESTFWFIRTATNLGYISWTGRINNAILPHVDNNFSIGSTALRWQNVFLKGYIRLYNSGTAYSDLSHTTWNLQNAADNIVYLKGSTSTDTGSRIHQPVGIKFQIDNTQTNAGYDYAKIVVYDDYDNYEYGTNMVIHSGGNVFIGGGESPDGVYNVVHTDPAWGGNNTGPSTVSQTSEHMFVTADNTIYIESNANTVADRRGIAIDTGGHIVPVAKELYRDGGANLGNMTYARFNQGHFKDCVTVRANLTNTADTDITQGNFTYIYPGRLEIMGDGGYIDFKSTQPSSNPVEAWTNGNSTKKNWITRISSSNAGKIYIQSNRFYKDNDSTKGYLYFNAGNTTYNGRTISATLEVDFGAIYSTWSIENAGAYIQNMSSTATGGGYNIRKNDVSQGFLQVVQSSYYKDGNVYNIRNGIARLTLGNTTVWGQNGSNTTHTESAYSDDKFNSGGSVLLYGWNAAYAHIYPTDLTSSITLGARIDAFTMPKLHIVSTANVAAYDSDIGGSVTQDAAKTINHSTPKYPAFAIGTITGTHIEMDCDEILAKSNETNRSTLYLNYNGGSVIIGSNLTVGRNVLTTEANIKCIGKAGTIYMWSAGTTTGTRGIYLQNSDGTVNNRLIGVDQNNRITDFAMMTNIPIRHRHSIDTSQAFNVVEIYQTDASTVRAKIGYHNTGNTNGALYLIPHTHTGNAYSGSVGLYIGETTLKWENQYVLRYSGTATDQRILVADGTTGDVKTGSATIAGLFTALSWTAGTSAGPVLNVTVGGTAKTATIPSASSGASGIVTNAAQTFGGIKTFDGINMKGSITANTDASFDIGTASKRFDHLWLSTGCYVSASTAYTGNTSVAAAGTAIMPGHIEMSGNTNAFIDFKRSDVTTATDYHVRLINDRIGGLHIYRTGGTNGNVTYNGRDIPALLYVQGEFYCSSRVESPTYFLCNLSDAGGAFYIFCNNAQQGRFYLQKKGTTETEGWTYLTLGNSKTSTTENNSSGRIQLYNEHGGVNEIYSRYGSITGWTDKDYLYTTYLRATRVCNAVWNDYAECRIGDTTEPGRVVIETNSGKMTISTKRLQPGCKVISDTFGSLMGETKQAKTPIAVAGRVLVYPYQDKDHYELGAAVCSAPNGTVDIMTREEIIMYPERIVGTVSEIPDYDIWYAGDNDTPIKVNGRIWIYVR